MSNKGKRARQRRPKRTQGSNLDAVAWKMPVNPPMVAQGSFPFSIRGNLISYGMDLSDKNTLTFSAVISRLQKFYGGLATGNQLSVQIHTIGVYGNTSTFNSTAGQISQQSPIFVQDAFTGKMFSDSGSPVVRARAGFHLAHWERNRWYNITNDSTISEHDLMYLRVGELVAEPPDEWSSAFDIIVKGIARYTRNPAS